MCCCNKPTINGEPGYSWDGKTIGVHPVQPPTLEPDRILYDEPGRCGGQDSHSFHFRISKTLDLFVRHGGGEEEIHLHCRPPLMRVLAKMDSDSRYWMLCTLYHCHNDAERKAKEVTAAKWSKAAVEKRIKVRKRKGYARVEILPEVA